MKKISNKNEVLPSSYGELLTSDGFSESSSFTSVTVPLTGDRRSLAALTLSNAPNVSAGTKYIPNEA